MSAKNSPQQDDLSEQPAMQQGTNNFDFDTWANQVRRQMVASLKKRTVVYGEFWGNNARANRAKTAEQEQKPEA
ncbi:hypothetical protein IFO70_25495 [Phormidium tenue FACHB-886]|nr:hypothetical protein [Phormidium tenue FACHB-886]